MQLSLLPAQHDFLFSPEAFPAIIGGLGSGKSRAGTIRLVLKLIAEPGIDGAYYMPTYDLIKLRAMPGVEEDLELLGLDYATNKSAYEINIKGYGKIIFRSYDNPNRIIAYEVAHSIVDELDTLKKKDAAVVWRKITERNRQKCKGENTIGVVTTPDQGINGFIYEKWYKKKQPGYIYYEASTYDNYHLPTGYTDQILANYDPILADLYLHGKMVSLNQNKVYHFYNRFDSGTDRSIFPFDALHIGLDFNIGGCCATVFVISGRDAFGVDEFKSYDTREFINNLSARYPKDEHGNVRHITIYPDSSGKSNRTNASQSDIAMIREAGFNCLYKPTNPAVRDRINSVNGGLAHKRLLINADKMPNTVEALESQGYDEKGEPEKFNDHPSIDDWCDSLGYFYAYRFPVISAMQRAQITGL